MIFILMTELYGETELGPLSVAKQWVLLLISGSPYCNEIDLKLSNGMESDSNCSKE